MAIIRSTDARARSAMSAGTSTSSTPSRSDRSSLAGVIIFMYLHTAARLTGSNDTCGLALVSWWSIPVSVATSTFDAVVSRAASTIPLVDRILVRVSGTTPAPTRYRALVAQPHSGWMNSSASGSSATRAFSSAPLIPAWTWHSPSQMCMFSRPGEALHVGAEELVRAEQHLGVGGDRLHDVDGVRRRAADVGLRLHRRRGVDVADDDGTGMLGLPRPQLVGGDRVGEAAPGALVGDQHGLVVAEDLGRLGHEVDAAEHDRRRLGCGGDAGQAERVADVVGDVLDLGQLVVVGEDHGVALARRARAPARASRVGSDRRSSARGRRRGVGHRRSLYGRSRDRRRAARPHRLASASQRRGDVGRGGDDVGAEALAGLAGRAARSGRRR